MSAQELTHSAIPHCCPDRHDPLCWASPRGLSLREDLGHPAFPPYGASLASPWAVTRVPAPIPPPLPGAGHLLSWVGRDGYGTSDTPCPPCDSRLVPAGRQGCWVSWTKVKRRAWLEPGLPHTGEEVQETVCSSKDLQGAVQKSRSQAGLSNSSGHAHTSRREAGSIHPAVQAAQVPSDKVLWASEFPESYRSGSGPRGVCPGSPSPALHPSQSSRCAAWPWGEAWRCQGLNHEAAGSPGSALPLCPETSKPVPSPSPGTRTRRDAASAKSNPL